MPSQRVELWNGEHPKARAIANPIIIGQAWKCYVMSSTPKAELCNILVAGLSTPSEVLEAGLRRVS